MKLNGLIQANSSSNYDINTSIDDNFKDNNYLNIVDAFYATQLNSAFHNE